MTTNASSIVATAFLLRSNPQIDTLVLDCSVTETHTAEIDVTDHPVEQGADISDHARPKPEMLTIEGIVSNTPLSKAMRLRQVVALGLVFQTTADAEHIIGQPGYGEAAYFSLRAMHDRPRLVTVKTSLRTYDNMMMMSLNVPRSAQIGESFRFTATFKSIILVTNSLTAAKTMNVKTGVPGSKLTSGKQISGSASGAARDQSILAQARDTGARAAKALSGLL